VRRQADGAIHSQAHPHRDSDDDRCLDVYLLYHADPAWEPGRRPLGGGPTPEALADICQMLGLDKPLIVQYGAYLWGAIQGDFGRSITMNYPITSYIWPAVDLLPAQRHSVP
jgi:Binding-prot-dependent transport system membrane comp, N-term